MIKNIEHKNIFHVVRGLNHGGIQEFLYTFIKYSNSNSFLKHHIVSRFDGSFRPMFEQLDCPIFICDDKEIAYLVKNNEGNCVVTHDVNGSLPFLHQHAYDLFFKRIPVINYVHNAFPMQSPPCLFKKIITTSKSNVSILKLNGVVTVPIPIDIERVAIKKNIAELKNKWRIPLNKVILGRISRLAPNKLILETIKAYFELRKKTNVPIFLLLAGEEAAYVPKGSQINMIKDLVSSLGLTDEDFLYLGIVTDKEKQELLNVIDIYSAPTSKEGYGIAFCEAALYGKPVVTYDNCANKEVVGNGGIVVKNEDFKALVEALKLLIENTELRKKLGIQGQSLINSRNKPALIIKQVEDIIIDVLNLNNNIYFYQYNWTIKMAKLKKIIIPSLYKRLLSFRFNFKESK